MRELRSNAVVTAVRACKPNGGRTLRPPTDAALNSLGTQVVDTGGEIIGKGGQRRGQSQHQTQDAAFLESSFFHPRIVAADAGWMRARLALVTFLTV